MTMTLGLKLSRRSIAVVVVADFEIVFEDVRHVPIKTDRMEDTIRRYLAQLLQQFTLTGIAYYAPSTGQSMASRLVQVLEDEARRTQLPIQRLNKADVFSGFGVVPVNTRAKLREQIARIWPVVAVADQGKVTARHVVLAEAAGVGLIGQMWSELPPP
jgi:hypothetical protein